MTDIASISLRVDTDELQRGSNELDKFQQKATGAAGAADGFNESGKETARVTSELAKGTGEASRGAAALSDTLQRNAKASRENTASVKDGWQELNNLISKINPGNKALAELEKITSQLAKTNREYLASSVDATSALASYNAMAKEGANVRKVVADAHNESAGSIKRQSQELRELLDRINPTNKAFEELARITNQLAQAHKNGLLPEAEFRDYNAILDDTRTKLQRTADAMTVEGRALLEQESASRKATVAQSAFIEKLREKNALYKASASESAAYRAEQLGIAQEAAPLIAAMRQQEEATRRAAEQKQAAAISARGLKEAIKEQEQAERSAAQQEKSAEAAKQSYLQRLRDQVELQGKATSETYAYRAAQLGISQEAAPLIAQMQAQERALVREADQKRAAAIAARGLKEALKEQEAAERAVTQGTQRAEATRKNFIDSLQAQAIAIGKTRAELLELKAGELGLSEQAAPFIARMREQDAAWTHGAVSAGQYRMAMRQLPMQITDVVTSLASGMPIWLVTVQQGGQIKDSFGGIGNALKALMSVITPARVLMGGMAGGTAMLATAYYKGSQEAVEFNKQLILTGSYAGRTASQLQEIARSLAINGLTQGTSANAIAKVVGSGAFSSSAITMVSRTAAELEKSVGQSIDTTIQQFKRLQDEPVKAAMELDKTLHFLTATQLEQIISLEKQGRTTDAAKVATESYAAVMHSRSANIKENLGSLESAWKWLGMAASGAWDSMLDVGRERTLGSKVEAVRRQLEIAEKNLNQMKSAPTNNSSEYGYGRKSESILSQNQSQTVTTQNILKGNLTTQIALVNKLRKELDGLQKAQSDEGLAAGRKKQEEDEQTRLKNQINTREELEQKYASKATQRINEIAKLNAQKWAITPAQYSEYLAEIERKYKDPKAPKEKAYQDDRSTSLLKQEQQRLAALLSENSALTIQDGKIIGLTEGGKRLAELDERINILRGQSRLSLQDQSVLKDNAALRAAIRNTEQQEILNQEKRRGLELQIQMEQYTKSIESRSAQELGKYGLSSRQQSRRDERIQLENTYTKKGGKIDADGKATGGSAAAAAYNKAIAAQEKFYADDDKLRGNWQLGVRAGWSEYLDSANNTYAAMSSIANSTLSGMADMLTSLTITGAASFRNFTTSILKMIADVINKLLVAYTVQTAMGWISAGVEASAAGASSVAGGSAAGTGAMGMSTSWASYVPHAKGGVYNSPSLSAYSNSVYDSPQVFAFAKGAGVFAEAGPEAIMPLKRGADGSLGIRAFGSSETTSQGLMTNLIKQTITSMLEVIGSVTGGVRAAGGLNEPNANGGSHSLPSLNTYSSQIVNKPTTFAFAKGAGLMGEAGPEAIMILPSNSGHDAK